jgi:hypothetical protein
MTKQFAKMHLFFPFREITLKDAFLHPETEDCTRGFAYSWHSRQRYQASIFYFTVYSILIKNADKYKGSVAGLDLDPNGSTLCGFYMHFAMQVYLKQCSGAENISFGSGYESRKSKLRLRLPALDSLIS